MKKKVERTLKDVVTDFRRYVENMPDKEAEQLAGFLGKALFKTPLFTTKEIREYLEGCRFDKKHKTWNHSLNNAITELEDFQDGIAAVTERLMGYKEQGK